MATDTRVIGCDPGASTGVVVVEKSGDKYELLCNYTVVTSPREQPTTRFATISDRIKDTIPKYNPSLLIVEQPLSWLRNGIPLLWMLAAAPVAAAKACSIPYRTIDAPTKRRTRRGWKLVGLATKDKARRACNKYFGKKITDTLDEHQIDACMMAIYGLSLIK